VTDKNRYDRFFSDELDALKQAGNYRFFAGW